MQHERPAASVADSCVGGRLTRQSPLRDARISQSSPPTRRISLPPQPSPRRRPARGRRPPDGGRAACAAAVIFRPPDGGRAACAAAVTFLRAGGLPKAARTQSGGAPTTLPPHPARHCTQRNSPWSPGGTTPAGRPHAWPWGACQCNHPPCCSAATDPPRCSSAVAAAIAARLLLMHGPLAAESQR